MLVPTNRLMLFVAALLPFTILAVLFPAVQGMAVFAYGLLAIVALLDAVLALSHSRDLTVTLPPMVRLSKDRPGVIPITFANESQTSRALAVGLPLPSHMVSPQDELPVDLPAGVRDSLATWPCTPGTRGNFPMNRCYIQSPSPYGLWLARHVSPCQTELRVYPNLMSERKRLAALFLNRGNYGLHTQRMIGQGRDFEKLRDYIPGDSFDDIHWKATAKRGRPITKLYQIERTQEIYVIVDSSRLSARAVDSHPVLERFITSALVLGLVAEQQGDLFGLISFDSKIRRFVRAAGGKAHYNACRDSLYTLMPHIVSPDFDELATFIRLRLRRRALLMILTDLGDPLLAESFIQNVQLIKQQHMVMVSMIRRPGAEALFSGPQAESVDDLYGKLAGHMMWRNLRELDKNLQRQGIGFSLVDNEKLSMEMVTQYMNVKARQML